MPAPNASDRERLLRLIDGGQEVLEELPKDQKPPEVPRHAKTVFLDKDVLKFIKLLVIFGLVFVSLHYGSEVLKTLKGVPPVPVSGSADLVPEDESGVGLRLVGVDSSDTSPVALLENLRSGKTYFARLNDRVGDAKVTQIQKNKVSVLVRGKTVELR